MLAEARAREAGDARPLDHMTWQFFGGRIGGDASRNDRLFAFAMDPNKLRTMMDDLDVLPADQAAELDAAVARLNNNRQGIILGREWLTILNKRLGDRFTLSGMNYKGIDLELEVVGAFPPGRYDKSAVIHRDYLNGALDAWTRTKAA